MELLLDTNVLLWWLDDSSELNDDARSAIAEPENLVYVSAVSVWEIVIKKSLGKLVMPRKWLQTLSEESFRRLTVSWDHALAVEKLPDLHRDPFDRLLIAQAQTDGLTLVTSDSTVCKYRVKTLKN